MPFCRSTTIKAVFGSSVVTAIAILLYRPVQPG